VTGTSAEHRMGRRRIDGAELRQRLIDVAAAIACTEEQVAETLERMALAVPDEAPRLLARAALARQYATQERSRAAGLAPE
jgi:hypothetical protein